MAGTAVAAVAAVGAADWSLQEIASPIGDLHITHGIKAAWLGSNTHSDASLQSCCLTCRPGLCESLTCTWKKTAPYFCVTQSSECGHSTAVKIKKVHVTADVPERCEHQDVKTRRQDTHKTTCISLSCH